MIQLFREKNHGFVGVKMWVFGFIEPIDTK